MSTTTTRRRGLCRSGATVTGYAYRSPDAEVRAAAGDNGTVTIEGYAVVWNRYSSNLGGYVEQIDPAAFDDSLRSDDQIASYNHDYAAILGRRSAGTVVLTKDNIGLRYEVRGSATDPDVARVAAKVRAGSVVGSSFSEALISNGFTQLAATSIFSFWPSRMTSTVWPAKLPFRRMRWVSLSMSAIS